MAREIDRLVVGAHGQAAQSPAIAVLREDEVWLQGAAPLMTSFGAPLLVRPIGADDIARALRYMRPERGAELLQVNVALGTVDEDGRLTDRGRALAEAAVAAQDEAVANVWSLTPDPLTTAGRLLEPLVRRVEALPPLRSPSAVELFYGTSDRPTLAGRVLRAITTMRYWRMDAHAVAQETAGLNPPEAHALNRAWMAAEGIAELPGQGRTEMGAAATRSLNQRELLAGDALTAAGRAVRDRIEAHTDELSAPAYSSLDEAQREELYGALATLAV